MKLSLINQHNMKCPNYDYINSLFSRLPCLWCRTYVLVTSISPLRAYFYHDGLVRFASSKYNQSDARRGKETQVLTNTSIGTCVYVHYSGG